MNPLATLGSVSALINCIRGARELAARGQPVASDAATFDTVLNFWGAILFEARDSCERARLMIQKSNMQPPQILYAPFTFQVIDAVLPEFFRAAPAPKMLEATTRLVGRLKRIDHFQRMARPQNNATIDPCYAAALGFANDLVNKGGIEEFNQIVHLAREVARVHFGHDADAKMDFLIPAEIDISLSVDESKL